MNIIFGIFVIVSALYINFLGRPKSVDAKLILLLIILSGSATVFGDLDFSNLTKGILSAVCILAELTMLVAFYAQTALEVHSRKKRCVKGFTGKAVRLKGIKKRSGLFDTAA